MLLLVGPKIGVAQDCPIFCRQKNTKEVVLPFKLRYGSARKVIQKLRTAEANTDIIIYIRGGDGNILEGEKVIDAMKQSKAKEEVSLKS